MPASWQNQIGRLIQISFWIILNQFELAASSLIDDNNSALSPLFEHYLIVTGVSAPLDYRIVRNATGHVIQITGVAGQMLQWLSFYYNFKYAPLQINETGLDATPNKLGLLNYLLRGDCDLVASVVPTNARIMTLDFSHPTVYIPVSFLIQTSSSTSNVLAVIQPFTKWVWISIIVSTMATFFSLVFCISLYYSSKETNIEGEARPINNLVGNNKTWDHQINATNSYLWGQFFKLGAISGHSFSHKVSIRLVSGVWFISAFVLVNYYTSLLIAYVAAPHHNPLIKSIYELRNRPEIYLVTEKNLNPDIILSSATSGFFKELGDKLRFYPLARCPVSKDCVDLVKSGSHVYVSGRDGFLLKSMRDDFQQFGKCNLQLGQENFMNLNLAWAFLKHSPYLDPINEGILRMNAAGLIPLWYKQHVPDAHQCLQTKAQLEGLAPLPLKGLTGAFALLLFGIAISLFVFIFEKIGYQCRDWRKL